VAGVVERGLNECRHAFWHHRDEDMHNVHGPHLTQFGSITITIIVWASVRTCGSQKFNIEVR